MENTSKRCFWNTCKFICLIFTPVLFNKWCFQVFASSKYYCVAISTPYSTNTSTDYVCLQQYSTLWLVPSYLDLSPHRLSCSTYSTVQQNITHRRLKFVHRQFRGLAISTRATCTCKPHSNKSVNSLTKCMYGKQPKVSFTNDLWLWVEFVYSACCHMLCRYKYQYKLSFVGRYCFKRWMFGLSEVPVCI